MSLPYSYFRSKAIRDPLYGFIDLSELETKVIDTEIFRRLQFIKQLSHAYVVYPSSIHTRFEHSLGTLYVSNIMANELGFTKQDDVERIRLSCLLHDIGHGPFSHLFESIIEKINPTIPEPHEKISKIMIRLYAQLNHKNFSERFRSILIATTGNGIYRTDYTQAAKGAQAKGHSNQAEQHARHRKNKAVGKDDRPVRRHGRRVSRGACRVYRPCKLWFAVGCEKKAAVT